MGLIPSWILEVTNGSPFKLQGPLKKTLSVSVVELNRAYYSLSSIYLMRTPSLPDQILEIYHRSSSHWFYYMYEFYLIHFVNINRKMISLYYVGWYKDNIIEHSNWFQRFTLKLRKVHVKIQIRWEKKHTSAYELGKLLNL